MRLPLLILAFAATAAAQPGAAPVPPPPRPLVAVLADTALRAGESVDNVFVAGGSATIDGAVRHDVVVLGGDLRLGPEAHIGGSVRLVGGNLVAVEGARVGRDVAVTFGSLEATPGVPLAAGSTGVIGTPPALAWIGPWIADGLLWGRPFPPQHAWAWVFAGVFLVVLGLATLAAPAPARATQAALVERPFTAYFTGLLVALLFLPLCLLLVATGIGVVLVPFVLSAFAGAYVFGRAAVYGFVGALLMRAAGRTPAPAPLVALLVGALPFTVLHAVPVVGLLAWGLVTPFALGAACLAVVRGARREAPHDDDAAAEALADAWLAPRAGFWRRTAAGAFDILCVGGALAVPQMQGAFLAVLTLYHALAWWMKQTTLGGAVFGVRLVRRDGHRVDFATALARALAAWLSALPLGLGFLWVGWSRDRLAWHDRLTGTTLVVVRRTPADAPPSTPSVPASSAR